eukprot:comp22793_c0_seq1/m.35713 comp22793_c0_seq1/g.35713  ORF comp22793_c0_seq1/g.35713 comp22793_c0_seq1/m.35713 type:complete len:623 (-) comp22793_c0_seq1:799-2667(-)
MAKAAKAKAPAKESKGSKVLSMLQKKAAQAPTPTEDKDSKENERPRGEENSEDEFVAKVVKKSKSPAKNGSAQNGTNGEQKVVEVKKKTPVKKAGSSAAKPKPAKKTPKKVESETDEEGDEDTEMVDVEEEKPKRKTPVKKAANGKTAAAKPKKQTKNTKKRAKDDSEDEDVSGSEENDENEGQEKRPTKSPKKPAVKKVKKDEMIEEEPATTGAYNKAYCHKLESAHPTTNARTLTPGMLSVVNAKHPLAPLPTKMMGSGFLYSMALSPDGCVLATASTLGEIVLWDMDTIQMLKKMRDAKEAQIDEFFVVRFSPDGRVLFAGGKRKDRKKWSDNDEDNAILPCPIKIFDVVTGEVVNTLEGHTEEVQHIHVTSFMGRNVLVSASQDGSVWRWDMAADWRSHTDRLKMKDNVTCMAFHIAPLPACGSKYFLGACDKTLKLYDLETGDMVQEFGDIYSSYCDCVEVVEGPGLPKKETACYVLTRGVEDTIENNLPSRDNRVILHKLTAPATKKGKWKLEEVRTFTDIEFHANCYLCRLATNGIYVAAPSVTGSVFLWSLATGAKVAVLGDTSTEREIRDIMFHPSRPQILVCGDDGLVTVYQPTDAPIDEPADQGRPQRSRK